MCTAELETDSRPRRKLLLIFTSLSFTVKSCCVHLMLGQVSQELGQKLTDKPPSWDQMWGLLKAMVYQQQQQQQQKDQEGGDGRGDGDAAAALDRYLRDSEAVPLTPPPYPGECCQQYGSCVNA